MGNATPSRAAVVEGLLLALSHSKLKPLAQADALRDILYVDYPDMVVDGVLDLEVFWKLLAEHPAFDADGAVAPMCVIKGWEERLGMDVQLPAKLQSLTEKDIALKHTECPVPKAEVARTLRTAEEQAARRSILMEALDASTAPTAGGQRPGTWRDHNVIGIVAGVVFLGAMVFLGMTTLSECGTGEWEGFNATEYASGIPISGAEELGKQVTFTLDDDGWVKRPNEERRGQMETALRALDARGTKALIVRDDNGRVRATAQWFDNRARIKIVLK